MATLRPAQPVEVVLFFTHPVRSIFEIPYWWGELAADDDWMTWGGAKIAKIVMR